MRTRLFMAGSTMAAGGVFAADEARSGGRCPTGNSPKQKTPTSSPPHTPTRNQLSMRSFGIPASTCRRTEYDDWQAMPKDFLDKVIQIVANLNKFVA